MDEFQAFGESYGDWLLRVSREVSTVEVEDITLAERETPKEASPLFSRVDFMFSGPFWRDAA